MLFEYLVTGDDIYEECSQLVSTLFIIITFPLNVYFFFVIKVLSGLN